MRQIFLAIGGVMVLGLLIAFSGFAMLFISGPTTAGPILILGAIIGLGGLCMGAVFVLLTELFHWDLRP